MQATIVRLCTRGLLLLNAGVFLFLLLLFLFFQGAQRAPIVRTEVHTELQFACTLCFRIPFGDHPLKLERYRED